MGNPWTHHLPKRLITWDRRPTWFARSFNDGEVVGTRSRVERALPLSTVIMRLGTRYLRSTRRLLTWIDSTLFPVKKKFLWKIREGNRRLFQSWTSRQTVQKLFSLLMFPQIVHQRHCASNFYIKICLNDLEYLNLKRQINWLLSFKDDCYNLLYHCCYTEKSKQILSLYKDIYRNLAMI